MTRDEHTDCGRTDPTMATRLAEAMERTGPLVDPLLLLIEGAAGNEHADDDTLKTAALDAYERACEAVATVGLEIRQRALEYTVVLGRAGLRIDVEFALAAPLDGPNARLEWERRSYVGFGAEASELALLDYARRYWLSNKLMLPTEADAHPPDWVEMDDPPECT